jgi:hypothetical protein
MRNAAAGSFLETDSKRTHIGVYDVGLELVYNTANISAHLMAVSPKHRVFMNKPERV